MKISRVITPANFFGTSLLILVIALGFANLQVKKILNSYVFANATDGLTACVYNTANSPSTHLMETFNNLEEILEDPGYAYYASSLPLDHNSCVAACTGEDYYEGQLKDGYTCDDYCYAYEDDLDNPINLPLCAAMMQTPANCKYIVNAKGSCESVCSEYSSDLQSGYDCSEVCEAISTNLSDIDAGCGIDVADWLNSPYDYQSGELCPDIYNNCDLNEEETYIEYVNGASGNCTNYGTGSTLYCQSPAIPNPLDDTCRTNCENYGFTQGECYAICTRYTEGASMSLCNSINVSDYDGSNNCQSATNRSEVLNTPTPTPTPTPGLMCESETFCGGDHYIVDNDGDPYATDDPDCDGASLCDYTDPPEYTDYCGDGDCDC